MNRLFSRVRSAILVFLTHHLALPILKLIRNEKQFPYSLEELALMPPGTLGNDLFHFLDGRKLKLLPYYARHDLKHILLAYDTTDEGEGCLQCFMLGNGHLSFPVLATVGFCFLTMPGSWSSFGKAYQRGRLSAPIAGWDWFAIVHQRTSALQAALQRRPAN